MDIGSGFGKCVFHTKIQCDLKKSVGIEYVKMRHEKSIQILEFFQNFSPSSSLLEGIEFCCEDATNYKEFMYSHIYCYDYIFTYETHIKLLPIIENSNFKVFTCFSSPKKLMKLGATQLQLLDKTQIKTTGGQKFMVYFYKKKEENF